MFVGGGYIPWKIRIQRQTHSVHPPLSTAGLKLLSNFQKGGFDRASTLRRRLLDKRVVNFFRGGCNFYKKINCNLKYLTTKKVYKQKFFSVITKNLNWEILSNNLITFKR